MNIERTAPRSQRELVIGWIDHICYETEGIDEFLSANYGMAVTIDSLRAMKEKDLYELYNFIANVRDNLN